MSEAVAWSLGGFLLGFALGVFVTMTTGLYRMARIVQRQTAEAQVAAAHAETAADSARAEAAEARIEAASVRSASLQHYEKQAEEHLEVRDRLDQIIDRQKK